MVQIDRVNRIIFDELLSNVVTTESKKELIQIVESLKSRGADCLILGCTELSLILTQEDISFPILDSAKLHALYAVDHIISTM
jgi:aspartate racemase